MRTRNLMLAAACLIAGCAEKTPRKPVPAVRVEEVTSESPSSGKVSYSAVAQAYTTTPLAFRGPGYIAELMKVRANDGRMRDVGEGDRVHRGDVVARLRDAEYRDKVQQATGQVAAARAAAEKARLDFERATRLFTTQSITRPEMESATAQRDGTRAQLAAAEATLEEARVALRDTALVVPVDADVVKKSVEPGSYAGPGSPTFVLGDISRVKVVLGVPDVALRGVKLGQEVTVTTDALPHRTFTARVSRIASSADPVTRNFDVEIEIPNGERLWKPGMIASAELTDGATRTSAPLLPLTAFVQGASPDRFAVMVVEGTGADARATLRPIELGGVYANRAAVARGLKAGERVITTGASMVVDGERVEVMSEEAP